MEFTFANENEKMKMLDQRFNFARFSFFRKSFVLDLFNQTNFWGYIYER